MTTESSVADLARQDNVLSEKSGLVVLRGQENKVVEEQALLGGYADRPEAGIHDKRRRKIAWDLSDGDERRLDARLEVDFEFLLDLRRIVRCDDDLADESLVVAIDESQNHPVDRGLLDVDLLYDLVLEEIKDSIAFPAVAEKVFLLVAVAHSRVGRGAAVLDLVLVLVESREVVRLQRLLARPTVDPRVTQALTGFLIAHVADRAADIAAAVLATEQIRLSKIVRSVDAAGARSSGYAGLADALTTLRIALADAADNTGYVASTLLAAVRIRGE